ncbi:MAG: ImmA/IrrE family metallo-endopeptidase [Methylovirgula sp.]
MKLADIGSPEGLADCIVAHYANLEIPIPLAQIADDLGITEIIGKATGSFEGVLVTNNAKTTGLIAYNEDSRVERRRFTIAHELAHFLLPFHGENAQCAKADMSVITNQEGRQKREAEANRFAAALLMPEKLFASDIRRLRAPEISHIVSLAERYNVSKESAARRYTELCDHLCAVVFSQNGLARYAPRKSGFPYVDVAKGGSLPSNSISAKGDGEVGYISDWSETAPETWLGPSARFRGKILYEQYLVQADGYRMTMLTLDDIPDEDEPDEDDGLENSWSPRFRR